MGHGWDEVCGYLRDRHSLVLVTEGGGWYTASGFDGDGDESCVLETLLLDCCIAFEAEMNEIVVLSDDVSSRTREVEGICFLDT